MPTYLDPISQRNLLGTPCLSASSPTDTLFSYEKKPQRRDFLSDAHIAVDPSFQP